MTDDMHIGGFFYEDQEWEWRQLEVPEDASPSIQISPFDGWRADFISLGMKIRYLWNDGFGEMEEIPEYYARRYRNGEDEPDFLQVTKTEVSAICL